MLELALERLVAAEPRRRPMVFNHIEDILTPQEYVALRQHLTDPELAALYAKRSVTRALAGQVPQAYRRNRIAPDVLHFSDPDHPSSAKTLLIGFAGRLGRLMIPNVGFIQCLPANDFDILILADPGTRHFRSGLTGYGDSFRGLVEAVARDFPRERYRRTVAIGASMGGLPSVWYGLMAGANRTICIGGRAAWDVTRMLEGDGPAHAYDPICACIAEPHPEIVFVYAQDHAIDRIQAGHFARILGAQTLPIPGVRNHSPLGHLWETGSLKPFLTRITQARSFRPRWMVQKKGAEEN